MPRPLRPQRDDYDSWFLWVADLTSYSMGTPGNIGLWLLIIGAWALAWGGFTATMSHLRLLPGWATSNEFNFPLNTGTSVAELFIGFLVGTAASRSEHTLRAMVGRVEALENTILEHIGRVEGKLGIGAGEDEQ